MVVCNIRFFGFVGDAEDLAELLVDDGDAHNANEDISGSPLSNIPNASGILSRSMYIIYFQVLNGFLSFLQIL